MLLVRDFGEPVDFGRCRSCGDTIAWVTVARGHLACDDRILHQPVPLDATPRKFGTLVVLADGRRAIELDRLGQVDVRDIRASGAQLYCCHFDRCDARGMRRAGWTAAAVVEGRSVDDPTRERRRAAKLATDRARDRSFARRNY